MANSLKDSNKLVLSSLMAANIALLYAAIQTDSILAGNWTNMVRQLSDAIPAGFGAALTGVINAQLSPEAKARIVFMRWNNALPGCEAFTRYANNDLRVETASIERVYGPFPSAPREQNALWYKLYKTVESDPAVTQVHRAFLLTRDYACLSMTMAIVLGIAGFMQIPSMATANSYLLILIIQFLLAGQAARNNGRRFVTTVLAIIGAK